MSLKDLLHRLLSPRPRTEDQRPVLADWQIASAVNEETGMAGVLRIRTCKPRRADIDSLTTAIVIKWAYESEDGMPPPEINQQQLQFETALDPLSQDNDNSELVQVFTGMGAKEWTFYARSRDIYMTHLNQLLSDHPGYPLEIEFYDDPQWLIWADFRDSLQG